MQEEAPTTRRIAGLRLQIAGLAVLLAAMAWQTFFSDWFDKSATEWQYFIQSEVNTASALAVQKMAAAMAASAPTSRAEELKGVANGALLELSKLTLERDAHRARAERRSQAVKVARFGLFAVGAAVLIVGLVVALPRRSKMA